MKENHYLCDMKKEEIITLFQEYEQAACEVNQVECWSARDLQKLLGYSLWQNFTKVIEKAKMACENVGQNIVDHFIDVNKKVELGSGALREELADEVVVAKFANTTQHGAIEGKQQIKVLDVITTANTGNHAMSKRNFCKI